MFALQHVIFGTDEAESTAVAIQTLIVRVVERHSVFHEVGVVATFSSRTTTLLS
jgi:hypothetical protein